jgi:hypothetical protein
MVLPLAAADGSRSEWSWQRRRVVRQRRRMSLTTVGAAAWKRQEGLGMALPDTGLAWAATHGDQASLEVMLKPNYTASSPVRLCSWIRAVG